MLLHYSACGFQLLPPPHAPSSLSSTQGDPGPCLAIPRSVGAWKLSPGSGPEDQWTHSAISRSVGAWTLSPGSGPEDRRTHRAIPRSVGAWTLPPGRGLEDQRTQRSFPSCCGAASPSQGPWDPDPLRPAGGRRPRGSSSIGPQAQGGQDQAANTWEGGAVGGEGSGSAPTGGLREEGLGCGSWVPGRSTQGSAQGLGGFPSPSPARAAPPVGADAAPGRVDGPGVSRPPPDAGIRAPGRGTVGGDAQARTCPPHGAREPEPDREQGKETRGRRSRRRSPRGGRPERAAESGMPRGAPGRRVIFLFISVSALGCAGLWLPPAGPLWPWQAGLLHALHGLTARLLLRHVGLAAP